MTNKSKNNDLKHENARRNNSNNIQEEEIYEK